MAYCTKSDLIARGWGDELISLSDKAGLLGGVIDDVALAQSIADATAEIDSYLTGHISLPIAAPSDYLIRIACDMVRYYLYDIGSIEPVTKKYDVAVKFLRGVATGETMLSSLTTVSLAPPVQVPVVVAGTAFFTETILAKM